MRQLSARWLRRILNVWPPFLFSGIRVESLDADFSRACVALHLRPWTRNYVGVHFGGSLFAMTDPFWMLMVKESLGRDYIVWDQAAEIVFRKPGRGTVRARFHLQADTLDALRDAAADGQKVLRWFQTDVVDAQGDVVASVRKQLYVRLKLR